MSYNATTVLELMLSALKRSRENADKSNEELKICKMNDPAPLSSFDYNKQEAVYDPCNFGFIYQKTPCAEGLKDQPGWEGNKYHGYCCEDVCDIGYAHQSTPCKTEADIQEDGWVGSTENGWCCDAAIYA